MLSFVISDMHWIPFEMIPLHNELTACDTSHNILPKVEVL